MKRLLVLVVLLVLAVGVLAGEAAAAPPANDDFANATVLASLPASVSESTVEAGWEDSEPASSCGGGFMSNTVWFAYMPPANGLLVADTVGSDFDTMIAVYTGSWLSLVEVDCNDDSYGPQSQLVFEVSAGVTYWFQVGGFSDSGSLVLNLDEVVVPANDDFADATVLSSLPASVSQSTFGASTEDGEPTLSCAYDLQAGSSVWFAYSPATGEGLVADTSGSLFDTVLAVYTGSLGSLSEVACNDDVVFEEDLWSRVQFQATAGITYYFQLTGFDGAAGNLVFNLESAGIPPTPGPAPGRIVVSKVTSPAGSLQAFAFHPSWGTDFTLTDGESHDSGGLPAGVYSVSESTPAGWQVSAACSDGSDPGAIGLAPGETVTCTFTNRWPMCFGQPATIVGTAGADSLVGTPGRDVIVGLGGDDVIRGLAGNDRICGGSGADTIYGGAGRDRIRGGLGRDTLFGGMGDDRLRGGIGVDWAHGGLGVDNCWAETTVACP